MPGARADHTQGRAWWASVDVAVIKVALAKQVPQPACPPYRCRMTAQNELDVRLISSDQQPGERWCMLLEHGKPLMWTWVPRQAPVNIRARALINIVARPGWRR